MRFGKFALAAFLPVGSLIVLAAPAQAQNFDFEDQTATYTNPPQTSRPGALTSLTLSKSGETVTITRQNGTAFDIVSNTGGQGGKPAAFGTKSLDPFFAPGTSGFLANFTSPLSSASLDFGDYGQDADTLTLNAYSGANGTGTLLATQTVNYGTAAFPTFATASVTGTGILSLTWSGTTNAPGFENSVFYDNLNVTPAATPEPGTLALLASFGLTGAGFLARRRKQAHKAV